MSSKKIIISSIKVDWLLYCVAALLMPNIFLFDLYNRNRVQSILPFNQTLILSVIFSTASIILLLHFKLITRALEGAIVALMLFWLAFWLFEQMLAWVHSTFFLMSRMAFGIYCLVFIMFLAIWIRVFSSFINKANIVFRVFAICICAFFVLNFVPGLRHEMAFRMAQRSNNEPYIIKHNFNINPRLPSPDIFWFHMDSMLSFEVMEEFFYHSEYPIRGELICRGFTIYEYATFNARGTIFSLPALFSPGFYDSSYHEMLYNRRGLYRARLMNEVIPYNETFTAFMSIGYEVIKIAHVYDPFTAAPFNWFYNISVNENDNLLGFIYEQASPTFLHRFVSGDFAALLALTTPLSLFMSQEAIPPPEMVFMPISSHSNRLPEYSSWIERNIYRSIIDVLSVNTSGPRFVFVFNPFAHPVWWYWQEQGADFGDFTRVDLYPSAFDYALNVALNAIDIIISENPNAIVILQSDHGFHEPRTHAFLLSQGYSLEQIEVLSTSVLSAVRIPPQYGGLDSPLTPLNISRELVNRFVGENYTLLP